LEWNDKIRVTTYLGNLEIREAKIGQRQVRENGQRQGIGKG